MTLFPNPPLTGKPGRPRALFCKRGHPRRENEPSCVKCRRYREQLKYHTDDAFRQKRCAYQSQWREDFFAKNGVHASEQYR